MALTAAEVRNAKAGERPYKLTDGGGLYLYVSPAGARSWRLKYRFADKERLLTFGLYPEVTLAEARERRDDARRLLRQDRDPGAERDRARREAATAAANTFEAVARQWHDAERARWSPGQAQLIMRALERDVFPLLGTVPIGDITGPDLLVMLRRVEGRGAIETATRISRTERQPLAAQSTRLVAERVQATVSAGSGLQRDAVLRLVRSACADRIGRVAGFVGVAVLLAGTGPDFMDDAASIFMGSTDLRVSFTELA